MRQVGKWEDKNGSLYSADWPPPSRGELQRSRAETEVAYGIGIGMPLELREMKAGQWVLNGRKGGGWAAGQRAVNWEAGEGRGGAVSLQWGAGGMAYEQFTFFIQDPWMD